MLFNSILFYIKTDRRHYAGKQDKAGLFRKRADTVWHTPYQTNSHPVTGQRNTPGPDTAMAQLSVPTPDHAAATLNVPCNQRIFL